MMPLFQVHINESEHLSNMYHGKMQESGYVANLSQMIQIAARPHAATFPQHQKKFLKTVIFCSRSCGKVALWPSQVRRFNLWGDRVLPTLRAENNGFSAFFAKLWES